MNTNTRACVAYVAIRLISGRAASAVFDYSLSKYISIDGTVSLSEVNVFDYDRSTHFGGNGYDGKFSLYDYGGSHFVDIQVEGNTFQGFDYGTSSHFGGDVKGTTASVFDYGKSEYFNYNL